MAYNEIMAQHMPANAFDHPLSVLDFAAAARGEGARSALVVVTETQGGAVRAPGALMAVREDGVAAGYVSNGCVDADIIAQAQDALAQGTPREIRYGEGSPFFDIRLPCGGAVSLLITPDPKPAALEAVRLKLSRRRQAGLAFSRTGEVRLTDETGPAGWRDEAFHASFVPKLRLRLAGRGADMAALAKLAAAAGFDVVAQSPDAEVLDAARTAGAEETCRLTTPDAAPDDADDPWTALVLMFHDHDWEPALLAAGLKGEAFYIGALGSRKTHAARCEALRARGVAEDDIARVRGPIGLVPRLRDASLLAVSTLAEIVAAFEERRRL